MPSPTFQTNNGAIRFAWEDASFPGYPKPQPVWKDFRLRSEGFGFDVARIPIGNLAPGNQPEPDLKGNVSISGNLELRWEPTVHVLLLAEFQKGGATVVDLVGVAASGTLTGDTIADGDTVTIGPRTYTFQTILTNVAGNVLVGASDSDSLDNLIAAINLSAGSGTLYAAATTIHPTVSAAAGAGDTMVATAKTKGVAGNAIATTAVLTAGDWADATLLGGIDPAYSHKLAPNEDDISFDRTFSLKVWRDDGLPVTIVGCRVPSWSITATVGGGAVQGGATVMGRAFTYYDVATAVNESTTPTRPIILGLPTYDNWTLADNDLYVKVTQVAGTVQVKCKRGSASTYDGSAITVTADTEITLTDENDDPIGDPDTPIVLYAPDLTNWALNDEWKFVGDVDEMPFSSSFPVIEALNVLNISLLVNDVERCSVQTIQTNGAQPTDPNFGFCGAFSPGLVQEGDRTISGTIEGRYIATDLKKMKETDQDVSLVVTYGSNVNIGEGSSTKYQIKQISRRIRLTGPSPTLSPGPFREPWGWRAYPSSDATYPDDITFEVQNNDSDLTA